MDVGGLPRVEHVAGLVGRGHLAADGIQAIDREHHQHALGAAVAQAHAVTVALLARDPALAVLAVLGQGLAAVAVDHRQVDRPGVVTKRQRRLEPAQGQHGKQGQDQTFHGRAPQGRCTIKRTGRANGVERGQVNWGGSSVRIDSP